MKKSPPIVFPVLLVLACCLFAGCASSPSGSQQAAAGTGTGGFHDVTTPASVRNYSFEEVLSGVFDNFPSRDQTHIQMISGDGLDTTGNANSWLIFSHDQDRAIYVLYDNTGEKVSDWPSTLPGQEIPINQIMSPKALFEKNRDLVFSTPDAGSKESRRLMLSGTNYTLTITGKDTTKTLMFDAKTGVLTS